MARQLLTLLQMAAFGWCMLLAAHLGSQLARCGRWGRGRQAAADFFFCLSWGVLFCIVLCRINGGLLRSYVLLGFLGGAAVYQMVFRARCDRLCQWVARGLLTAWRGVRWVFFLPWRALARLVLRPCRWCLGALRRRIVRRCLPPPQESDALPENFIKK